MIGGASSASSALLRGLCSPRAPSAADLALLYHDCEDNVDLLNLLPPTYAIAVTVIFNEQSLAVSQTVKHAGGDFAI